jgi:hypothetical protein
VTDERGERVRRGRDTGNLEKNRPDMILIMRITTSGQMRKVLRGKKYVC